MAWYPLTTPILAVDGDVVVLSEEDSIDPCGFGTVENTDIVEISIEAEEWANYCGAIGSSDGNLQALLFPLCDNTGVVSGQQGGDFGTVTSVLEKPTQVTLTSGWSGLQANRNATGGTYNLGTKESENPYWDRQFRGEKPHTGCGIEHIHSDATVYAFQN